MNLKKALGFFLFSVICLLAKAGNGFVFLADTSKLFYVSDNQIYSPDKRELLYFQKGNIFFKGSNEDKSNIFLLTTSMNIASEKYELIYERGDRQPTYSFRKNKFYSKKNVTEDDEEKKELIHMEQSKKWLAFYSSANDSLLGYYNSDTLPASTAIIVAYTLLKKFELEKRSSELFKEVPRTQNSYSTIKPFWGNTTANEWLWDENIFRPRWNVDPRFAWAFDGETVKPFYGNNIYDQYSWDGEIFKPLWRTNRAQEWSWDGKILKPIWDTDWANQYKIEDGVIHPWSNVHPEKEWQLNGNLPIPLIVLIISGIAQPE